MKFGLILWKRSPESKVELNSSENGPSNGIRVYFSKTRSPELEFKPNILKYMFRPKGETPQVPVYHQLHSLLTDWYVAFIMLYIPHTNFK